LAATFLYLYITSLLVPTTLTNKPNTMDILEQVAEIRAKKAMVDGREEGIIEAKHAIVKKMLLETELSEEKIASLADVPVGVVKKMKKDIRK
jgi:predicted transposase YdaD